MNRTLYKTDISLNSEQLDEILPGRAYVRHGGRAARVIHHKNGTESTTSSIIWDEVTVVRVWVDCTENSDDVEVRKSYALHILMDGGELLDINLTAKQYNRLAEYKYMKPAAKLLTEILKKDGKGLLIRRLVATKKFSFRAHRNVAELIEKNSKKCGLSWGEYIERCCSGTSPRLALDEEEKKLLREFARGRQDIQFFFNMLSTWRQGKTNKQLAEAVVMGEKFLDLRKELRDLMQKWDKTLGKLLNRQIEDKT